ncbi:MAG: flagellar basal body-associated FliL family protein [Opitutaceae bacterium]|nr:flagellar basal body-associated FliL family protein [Verrucomicrobiales bacterium]
MADRTSEASRTSGDIVPAPAAAGSGGIKAWLPLIITALAMPALAIATTKFILLPKLHQAAAPAADSAHDGGKDEGKAEGKPDAHGKPGASGKGKFNVALSKIIVNVSGTMGTRYLMSSVTLTGSSTDFKAKIDDNKDQLLDLASGTLSSKTIADLEKPGARNQIRTELMAVFNNALGGNVIQEIFITELAIQ